MPKMPLYSVPLNIPLTLYLDIRLFALGKAPLGKVAQGNYLLVPQGNRDKLARSRGTFPRGFF